MRVLLTGASSGIGKDMAKILNKKKYDLILVARDEEKLNIVKKELEKENLGNKIEIISLDLSVEENCISLCEKVKDIDILINNAGFGDCGDFTKTDLNKEIKMIKTNIIAYHILMKEYLKQMKEKNSGKILNVASIAGFMPVREELKKENSKVQISILCPGPVATNFNNVANVKFKLREANSFDVAKYAIKKMEKGKFYIVPGLDTKLGRLGAKIFPANLVAKVTYKVQKRKLNR